MGLSLILVLAALLRFYALDFGEGVLLARPDEVGVIMALVFLARGIISPVLVVYGGGYELPLSGMLHLVSLSAGHPTLDAMWRADPQGLIYASRAWSATLATVTVWLTHRVGCRLAGDRVGLVAALLVACAPLAVRDAHFGKPDTAAALAFTVALLPLVGTPTGALWRACATGAAAGLCASTKALLGPLPALAVAVVRDVRARARIDVAILATAAAALVFFTVSYYWLTSPVAAWESMQAWATQYRDISQGWRVAGLPAPWVYHATVSLRYGCGVGFALLSLPALGVALATRGGARLVGLAVLGHLALVLSNRVVLASYILPCVPALAVLVALLVVRVGRALARAGSSGAAAVWLLAAVLVAEPLWNAVRLVALLGETDTRSLAGEWIDRSLPADARIVSWGSRPSIPEFGLPPLHGRPLFRRLDPSQWRQAGVSFVVWHHYPLPFSSEPLPAAALKLRRVVVFDPFESPGVSPVTEPVDAFYLPLGRFSGVVRPGPRIEILAVEP